MAEIDLDQLYDNRSDPDARSVLEDFERSRYRSSTVSRLGFALSIMSDAADAADADADDADADADAAAADADAAAAADAADAAADAALKALHAAFTEEPDMRPGLKILQIQITYYRAITFVGWLKRDSGDEYLLVNSRIISRKSGEDWSWNGINELAENGPGKKYDLTPTAKLPEEMHRLGNIRRSKPADEKAWAKHCPRPKDWPSDDAPG